MTDLTRPEVDAKFAAFATATVSILTFMINTAGPKQTAAQQAPIVITVPGAAVAPAAPRR